MNHVGEEIRDKRKKLRLTQAEVAGEHMSVSKLSNIENGKILPDPQTWSYLQKTLGLDEKFTEQKQSVVKVSFLLEQAGTYETAGLEAKAIEAYEEASALATELMLLDEDGRANLRLSALLIKQRRFKEAGACLDKARNCFLGLEDCRQLVEVELAYTNLFYYEEKFKRSLESAFQALHLIPEGESAGRGIAHYRISRVLYRLQRQGEANVHCEQALFFLKEEDGDEYIAALILFGILLKENHLYRLSRDYQEKARASALRQKKTQYIGVCLQYLGELSMEEGDFDQALNYFMLASDVKEKAEYHPGMIQTKLNFADLYNRKENFEKAKNFALEALQMAREQHSKMDEFLTIQMICKICEAEENEKAYLDLLLKAITLAEELELTTAKGKLLEQLAEHYGRKGNRERCMEKYYQSFLVKNETAEHPVVS